MAKKKKNSEDTKNVVRVQGKLHDIIHVTTPGGKKHKVLKPLQVEFHPHDVLQIILGAAVLATPVGFTQEVWDLAAHLSTGNIILVALFSLLIISSFVYYNFYHGRFDEHLELFFLRIGTTYILSLLVVSIFLLLIGKLPYLTDLGLAIKRVILIGFPASMSAAVSDSLK